MPFIPTTTPGEYPEHTMNQVMAADLFFIQRLAAPQEIGRQMQGAILPRLPGPWPRQVTGCPEGTSEILFLPGMRPIYEVGPGPAQLTT